MTGTVVIVLKREFSEESGVTARATKHGHLTSVESGTVLIFFHFHFAVPRVTEVANLLEGQDQGCDITKDQL